jgi:ubiquinone biosynthesis protein COQ4
MPAPIDRAFGEKYLACTEDFYRYGVHLLFNEWWVGAPQDAIEKYVAAIADHPEQGPLARTGWLAEPFSLKQVEGYASGTLGAAWRDFMVDNGLVEKLAEGYRDLTDDFAAQGKLDRMPPILRYKVLRGYQTHDLHHVLTGYAATPFDELALQAFQLAQQDYPYSAMTLSNHGACRHRRSLADQARDGCDHRRLGLRSPHEKHSVRRVRNDARTPTGGRARRIWP